MTESHEISWPETKLREISWPDTPFPLENRLVLVGRRGSEAHGTYVPSDDPNSVDDRDVLGIVVPPLSYYFGLEEWQGADSIKGVWDVVLYELRKFVRLLLKQNPNVLGLLWLEKEDYLHVSGVGRLLIERRDLFRHRQVAFDAFTGYAKAQLKKMSSSEKKYLGYMGEKRKRIVDRYGYDVKNAAHLIRLLYMCRDYLRTGGLTVRLRDAPLQVVRDIKRGRCKLDNVKAYADDLFRECERVLEDSPLPLEYDRSAINKVVMTCVEDVL